MRPSPKNWLAWLRPRRGASADDVTLLYRDRLCRAQHLSPLHARRKSPAAGQPLVVLLRRRVAITHESSQLPRVLHAVVTSPDCGVRHWHVPLLAPGLVPIVLSFITRGEVCATIRRPLTGLGR